VTTPSQLIALLNSLTTGDLDAIRGKLDEARAGLAALGFAEVDEMVAGARAALDGGDLKTYRKRVASAIAKLGHLR
jgi:flavin-binding protein dodecin